MERDDFFSKTAVRIRVRAFIFTVLFDFLKTRDLLPSAARLMREFVWILRSIINVLSLVRLVRNASFFSDTPKVFPVAVAHRYSRYKSSI